MSLFEENIRVLSECQPALAEELQRQTSSRNIELSPLQDKMSDVDAIVIAGLPDAESWLKLMACNTPYIIVSHGVLPDLRAYLSVLDLRRPLLEKKLCFAVGDEGVLQLLNDLFGTLYRRKIVLFGYSEFPGYASSVKEMEFFDTLCAANRATLDQFAAEWQNNLSDNFKDFLRGPFLQDEAGRWRDCEAVLVAAGPSLDQADLPADFGSAAVVACDTAVPVLVSRGITPDVIVTLDSSESNRIYLKNLPAAVYKRSVLCVTPVVESQVYSNFQNILFYSYGHPTLDHLRDSGMSFEALASGGSVALTAVDALRYFGVRRVYLLGCDFRYFAHQTHARGTGAAFRALFGDRDRFRTLEYAIYEDSKESSPGSYQVEDSSGRALTDKKLQKWRDWLELYVKNRNVEIFQMSKIAAPIPGIAFGRPGRDVTPPRLRTETRELSADLRRELKFMTKEVEMALSAPRQELVMRVKALPRVGKCMGYVLAWLATVPNEEASDKLREILERFHAGVAAAVKSQG